MDKIKIGFNHKMDENNPQQTNVVFERITIRNKPMKGWCDPTYVEVARMTYGEWNKGGSERQDSYLKKLEAKHL